MASLKTTEEGNSEMGCCFFPQLLGLVYAKKIEQYEWHDLRKNNKTLPYGVDISMLHYLVFRMFSSDEENR